MESNIIYNNIVHSAWLVTNYTCNSNCSFCYARHSINKIRNTMDFDFACKTIDELVRIGVKKCILIGGEPTLYDNLINVIKYGRAKDLNMYFVSNGRKLANREFVKELISAGINGISVSLESATREEYKIICGADGFYDTIEGIKNCVEEGIKIATCTTICSSNYIKIAEIAQCAYKLGVRDIVLNFAIPSIDVSDGGGEFLSPSEMARAAYETFRILKRNSIPHRFYGTIPMCAYTHKMRNEMIEAKVIPNRTQCQLFSGSGIVFEPDGLVTPCTHWINLGLFQSSDSNGKFTLDGKLDEKWMERGGSRMKLSDKLQRYTSNNCKTCTLWGKCLGGCPLFWNKFDPDNHTKPVI